MDYEAIVIGTSAGGLNALQEILVPLPANFALPILVVQHRPPAPEDFLAFTLNELCQLRVKEADEKESIKPGFVYIAPANYHLLIEPDKTMSLSAEAKVCYSRPSIDVLFESAAEVYLSALIGIILTGANNDGTAGLKKIKKRGGLTIAQDPATAESEVMPLSAIRESVVDKIFSLPEILSFLLQLSDSLNNFGKKGDVPRSPQNGEPVARVKATRK
ncbi:MAG: chemotaxis protein CheB [Anaerolineae bacterium]|nr:chemotaxis protein CheB [Anaerolineae bacterium]